MVRIIKQLAFTLLLTAIVTYSSERRLEEGPPPAETSPIDQPVVISSEQIARALLEQLQTKLRTLATVIRDLSS